MIKDIAILSPVFITLFWSLVFFIQPQKKDKAKLSLGKFMSVAFILYFTHAIFFTQQLKLYAYLESVYILTVLSVYPLYYFYLRIISSTELSLKHKILHLLPGFLISCCALSLTLLLSPNERVLYVQEILIDKNLKQLNFSNLSEIKGVIFLFSRSIFIVQAAYYMVRGISIARKHNERILNYYSNTEGKTMNWVLVLHIVLLVISVTSITFAFIGRSYFLKNEISLIIPSAIFSIFLFTIGLNGNIQISVAFEINDETNKKPELLNDKEFLKRKLEQLFTEQEIFKNQELRITHVVDLLKTNRTYVSNLINEEYNMNFNEFVNKFRVEAACKLLLDKNREKFTLEHIAERSGFGSVSSFSRVFKMHEGISPGKFRDKTLK